MNKSPTAAVPTDRVQHVLRADPPGDHATVPRWLQELGSSLVRLAVATPAPMRRLVHVLPPQPPSFLLSRLLDQALLPRLDAEARASWSGRAVQIELEDLGARLRLCLGPRGFRAASMDDHPAVTVRGSSSAFWRLVRGVDDADRLFFERALVMEGDTEFGLVLKNTLDAIGPLWC